MADHRMGRIPTFSQAERERRWARVRRLMAREGLDALVAFPNSGHWDHFQADVRYLTQIGGNCTEVAVVFPLEGEVSAVLRGENDIAWWSLQQDWVTDLRPARGFCSLRVAEQLKELGLERGRIGISGLEGLVRAPEGIVVWGMFERLRKALPHAILLNTTHVLQEARAIKSVEEVEFIRKAAGLAETAVERMMSLARPGIPERHVYGAMVQSMIAGGGEIPTMILWGAGQQPPWPHRMLTDRMLQKGDMINNEVEARWAGYIAQVVAPCCLGPIEPAIRHVFDLSLEIFNELRAVMRPGLRFVDIQRHYREAVTGAGFEEGAALLHGRGLGEDRPLMRGDHPFEDESLALEEGMVFILKPAVFPPGGRDAIVRNGETVELAVRAGDTVLITANGAERLSKRRLELVAL